MIQKTDLRQILIKRRKALSKERREEAALLCFEALKSRGKILSFSPIGSEIDVTPLNEFLKKKGLLVLFPHQVASFIEISLSHVDCILVPGLGFDREMYRIGYGKGCYDQFLARATKIPTIGIGFKEQFYEGLLPKDPWDIPVKELLLF